MPAREATAKAVEAMVLKNKFLHAETRGDVVVGQGETAAALVQAVPLRDGVFLTIVTVSADNAEAERLRNAIRNHVFSGPYDPAIPAKLDRKTARRPSTAPDLHYHALQVADNPLHFRACARSTLVQNGLEADVQADSLLFGRKPGLTACITANPSAAAGKADVLLVVAGNPAEEAAALAKALAADLEADRLAPALDLCKYQTAIRNQGGRDVCPYFPPVAALEAAYCRAGAKVDLSTEHLIWLRNVTAGGTNDTRDMAENLISTLGGGNGMGVLATYAVCREQDLPFRCPYTEAEIGRHAYYKGFELEEYHWSKPFNQFVLNRWNLDPSRLPPRARANARYGIAEYVTLRGPNAQNLRRFEEILAGGREIVFALMLHQDIHRTDPAQPVWRRQPGAPFLGYHFMLAVGYDRERKFLVVKNQWGPTNYSANRAKLAEGWKDLGRYDGYTLVDYKYLAHCGEAYYITAVTPLDSRRYVSQRALGQWEVIFTHKDQPLMTGVLCWRRLPDRANEPKPNRRVGDLVTREGQSFRVNGELQGDGSKPYQVTLHIDFAKGSLPADSKGGTAWSDTLTLPDQGGGSLRLGGAAGAKEELWGAEAAEIQLRGALVEDRNLLKDITPAR
jgi:hypothetical protein